MAECARMTSQADISGLRKRLAAKLDISYLECAARDDVELSPETCQIAKAFGAARLDYETLHGFELGV